VSGRSGHSAGGAILADCADGEPRESGRVGSGASRTPPACGANDEEQELSRDSAARTEDDSGGAALAQQRLDRIGASRASASSSGPRRSSKIRAERERAGHEGKHAALERGSDEAASRPGSRSERAQPTATRGGGRRSWTGGGLLAVIQREPTVSGRSGDRHCTDEGAGDDFQCASLAQRARGPRRSLRARPRRRRHADDRVSGRSDSRSRDPATTLATPAAAGISARRGVDVMGAGVMVTYRSTRGPRSPDRESDHIGVRAALALVTAFPDYAAVASSGADAGLDGWCRHSLRELEALRDSRAIRGRHARSRNPPCGHAVHRTATRARSWSVCTRRRYARVRFLSRGWRCRHEGGPLRPRGARGRFSGPTPPSQGTCLGDERAPNVLNPVERLRHEIWPSNRVDRH